MELVVLGELIDRTLCASDIVIRKNLFEDLFDPSSRGSQKLEVISISWTWSSIECQTSALLISAVTSRGKPLRLA